MLTFESFTVSAILALVFFRENYQSIISSGSFSEGSAIKSEDGEVFAHLYISKHHYGKEIFEINLRNTLKTGP